MEVPSFIVNSVDLENMISFICKHEDVLKTFGAIKIETSVDCRFSLKKRPKKLSLDPVNEKIIKINSHEEIYRVEKVDKIIQCSQERLNVKDESTFWSSLSLSLEEIELNISFSSKISFFRQKVSHLYFDIHRLPKQSILQLGGQRLTRQIVPCVRRAHQIGSIFPLTSNKQGLFSIDYHHEGGIHHWYIIPKTQRKILENIISKENLSICLDHGQIFVDPKMLNKYNIIYYKIVQNPKEFVVLSSGTLFQSYTEDKSWNESILFGLPSWIGEDYLENCQCNIYPHSQIETIDINLFKDQFIQKYINTNFINDKYYLSLKGQNRISIETPSDSSKDCSLICEEMVSSGSNVLALQSSSIYSPSSTCFFDEDKQTSDQLLCQILGEECLQDDCHSEILHAEFIESILSGSFSDLNPQNNQNTQEFPDIHQNLSADSNLFSYEDLMNLAPCTNGSLFSTSTQLHGNIDTVSNKTIDASSNCFLTEEYNTTITVEVTKGKCNNYDPHWSKSIVLIR